MLMLISPAKTLDYTTAHPPVQGSQPDLMQKASQLIDLLRELSPAQIAELMHLSDPLAVLNFGRYQQWQRDPALAIEQAPAAFAFMGDVYEGLDARSLNTMQLDYLTRHLRILSGLYGLLRPLDALQPYRLEMGTRLANPAGRDLYAFWGQTITDAINALQPQCVVNLASDEYFKAVRPKLLGCPLITPVFEEFKNGRYKIISFYAKRARGLMVRYAAVNGIREAEQLKQFDCEGYEFAADESSTNRWVFRREAL